MPSVCAATTLPGGIARYLCVLAAVGFLATLGVLPVASAGRAQADETVNVCGPYPDEVFGGGAVFGIATAYNCSTVAGAYLDINTAGNTVASGQRGTWQANAPADLLIKDVSVLSFDVSGVNDGNQYGGGFYWPGGGAGVTDGAYSGFFGVDDGDAGFPASYFGFQVVCGASPCTSSGSYIHVEQMALDVEETVGPTLSAGGLWGQQGWVRGNWPISVNGDSASGICQLSAAIDGQTVAQQSLPQDTAAWHQCNATGASGLDATINTNGFSNGSHTLTISGTDAAGLSTGSNYATAINVDNSTPVVSISGPSTASSAEGTQYVTATASDPFSGIAEIQCSVDGGASVSYPGAAARVPVSGIGTHTVSCSAEDNAVDGSGDHGQSAAPATFSMDIGEPTVSGISFTNILHSLKCKKVEERVKIAAMWVTVRRHGKLVKVHRRAHTKREKVMKCKMREVKRKVTVTVKVKRHGKTVLVKRKKVERIPVPPEAVTESTKRVAFGKGTIITGFLDTATGVALAGHTVDVLTAPDNQLGQWSQAAAVTTAANGGWSATLPAGSSRLVEAAYAGDSTTLPATSATATLLVPAHIGITITPRRLPWSGAVTIRGHLSGGYVPPDGVPLYLEIDTSRRHRPYTPVPLRTNARGTFSFQFSWKSGGGVTTYPMRVALLGTGSDYPFVASSSRAVSVTFGRATPKAKKHAHHKHRKRHKKKKR